MKYVISHKITSGYNNEIIKLADECEMYAKLELLDNDNVRIDWVDIENASKFEDLKDAKLVLHSLPFDHTIMKYK